MAKIERTVLQETTPLPEAFVETFRYWRDMRGDAWAARWSEFQLEELEPQILPWAIVVDVETEPVDFFYRFWGTERCRLIGVEMTGKRASDIPDRHMREANIAEYHEVCELKKPLLCRTPVVTASGRRAVFQSLRLPLSDDGEAVTQVFSAVNHAEISTVHYEYYGTEPAIGTAVF